MRHMSFLMRRYRNPTLMPLADDRSDELFALLKGNVEHYRHMREQLSPASFEAMLRSRPPGMEPSGKHNLVSVEAGEMLGFVELLIDYPDPLTATIGLLIVRADLHGQGIGGCLLEATFGELRRRGVREVFLSCASDAERAARFWQRHGFGPTGDVDRYDDLSLIAMHRTL